MEIKYHETTIQGLVEFYMKGFDPKTNIVNHESFIDQRTGKVLLKLYIEPNKDENPV